jgi:mannose/cellobiose epimerase-like protein (N-acyl-D-glucosamine 2-epimerase family)
VQGTFDNTEESPNKVFESTGQFQPFHTTAETTLLGHVESVAVPTLADDPPGGTYFILRCRNDRMFFIRIRAETAFIHLQNLDRLDRDRVHTPGGFRDKDPLQLIKKYVRLGQMIVVQGVSHTNHTGDSAKSVFDAQTVYLLRSSNSDVPLNHIDQAATPSSIEPFLFEEGHWWINQINGLGHTWLNWQFGDTTSFDYHHYTSNLGITGFPLKSHFQECATLSRLIYGLSSAYLLTGADRYLAGARAGVEYQREYFRSFSHDGQRVVWSFGKDGSTIIVPSQSGDDKDTIPLYEQIYCLAGLAQYYRITQDWEVLEDIRRTVNNFDAMYRDEPVYHDGQVQYGGYFSHIDYATMRWDAEQLGQNRSRKNWNSVGDHIPAYLLNMLLALEPLPADAEPTVRNFRNWCHSTLRELCLLITSYFPDPDRAVPYVRERFFRTPDWQPDLTWGWQQNRAIVGHNLKIAWNLCRVHAAFESFKSLSGVPKPPPGAPSDAELQSRILDLAKKLGNEMAIYGLDPLRGGCFDAVERKPANGMPIEFTWSSTKDFWQQEQAILAYLTLYAQTGEEAYLGLARECMAFWNLFFLDRDNGGVFFRVSENGMPESRGSYGIKAGHAISGYHAFELNYLAHILIRAFVRKEPFILNVRPSQAGPSRVLNVMPDFLPVGRLQISKVTVNGRTHPIADYARFQVCLKDVEAGSKVVVEYTPC